MLRAGRLLAAAILLAATAARPCHAQGSVAIETNVLFYGDNTEFRNPFREGETIFGAAVRLAAAADLGDRTTLTIGVFANQRFGSDDAFDLVRPVVTLRVGGKRSSFILGTLPPSSHTAARGPDLNGPHALLPPLQRESLAFDRPYEAGLQWLFSGSRFRHDIWLNWQQINTPEHRERFDAGANGEIALNGPFVLPFQLHIVHEGGQLFAAGPVADSLAAATGLAVRGSPASLDAASLEMFAIASRFVPDRSAAGADLNGAGFLARASAERAGWRGHLLVWRGNDFIKDEGDPNYQSFRRDGARYRGTRDYSELGLTRIFRQSSGVSVHASARIHRIEKHYEYSYRILAVVDAAWRVK